jgi:hypothetical protein
MIMTPAPLAVVALGEIFIKLDTFWTENKTAKVDIFCPMILVVAMP